MHDADVAQINLSLQSINGKLNDYNRELGEQSTQLKTQTGQITEIFQRLNNPETFCTLGKANKEAIEKHNDVPHNGKRPKSAHPAVIAGTGAGAGAVVITIVEAIKAIFSSGGSP